MTPVSFPKGPTQLAGLLWKPSNSAGPYSALIILHPGGGVKEQTASLYGEKLSHQGFLTLTFDAAYQGESGGDPHFLEDPNSRVSDVSAAIDYLQTRDDVKTGQIGVLGICAGGGYAVAAAKGDHRLKAVSTISMVNIGDSVRRGWNGDELPSKHVELLNIAAQQMQAEVAGAEPIAAPYVPPQVDKDTLLNSAEANDYYLTPRCQHPRAANKMLLRSMPMLLQFDAFNFADLYLKQPILTIVGDRAGSKWHTDRLEKMIGGATRSVVMPGGTHMDFYDRSSYVDPAVQEVADFMQKNPK